MTEIDDRIIVMKFDNASFEKAMGETIKSLDKLRKSLEFSNAKKGFSDINSAAKSLNMGHMHAAIDGVNTKFLAMATIGITALSRITSAAIDTGVRMAKALTLDPIMDGFQEFETNMNSIQTILANTSSKGSTLEDVNKALDQLNTYSDKTIYNFSQMTRNIGTFTAAGIDLETSVQSIKGISNLAAISGSNSEQASTAMYQLSQALASGTLKLMDWNSVVNAGMGGEVFQKALFETGKALGTIKDVPMSQTFDQWKDAGNSFRNSLQDGWITAEVLTTTLQGFTGDLKAAQLVSMGFTQEQAKEIEKMGAVGLAAATEVKTFTQLMSTLKEAMGSGWSQSFRTIIGDFNEAKGLFTGFNQIFSGIIAKSAKTRNDLLAGWRYGGGREILLGGIFQGLQNIGTILKPIKEAFRDIFPKKTAVDLLNMTKSFANFAERLKIGAETSEKLKSIFRGFFAALEIGFEVVKGIANVVRKVFSALMPAGTALASFGADTGDLITRLNEALVEGQGISRFFDKLAEIVIKPIAGINKLKDIIVDFFSSFSASDEAEKGAEKVGSTFETLAGFAKKLADILLFIPKALGKIVSQIVSVFGDIGSKIVDALSAGDLDRAFDILKVGLLGGLLFQLRNFVKNGLSIDLTGGLFDKFGGVLDSLKDHLKALQLEIKAKALLKIAYAIAILTASVLVLSMIDAAALTKALVAMTVGFGELVGAMTGLAQFTGPATTGKFIAMGITLILLSGAMLILTFAIKQLSSLDVGELAKGLGGVALALAALIKGSSGLASTGPGMIRAGIALIPMALALIILSKAVSLFSHIPLSDMIKGLASVIIFTKIMGKAMEKSSEKGTLETALAMFILSFALKRLAQVIQIFAGIPLGKLVKGILSVGATLAIMGEAMKRFPKDMPKIALSLALISFALLAMSFAISKFGGMKLSELVTGIGAIAATLLVLGFATKAMSGSVAGAAAIVIVAGAMLIFVQVIKELAKLKITELITAIVAMAAVFLVLGAAAALLGPVLGPLLGMGVALGLLGAGFALLGIGVMFIAKAFEILARSGAAGAKALVNMVGTLAKAIPQLAAMAVTFAIDFISGFIGAIPELLGEFSKLFEMLLDVIIKLAPKFAKALTVLVKEAIGIVRKLLPEFYQLGMDLILGLGRAIRDNIGDFVTVVSDIIQNFLDAMAEEIPQLVTSLTDFFIEVFTSVAYNLGRLGPTLMIGVGASFLEGFWEGMTGSLGKLLSVVTGIIKDIIGWFTSGFGIASPSKVMMDVGKNIILGLIEGVKAVLGLVKLAFIDIPRKIVGWIGNVARLLYAKGKAIITGLLNGVKEVVVIIASYVKELPGKIVRWIGDVARTLYTKGRQILGGLLTGISEKAADIYTFFTNLKSSIIRWVGDSIGWLYNVGRDIIRGLWDGIKSMKDWIMDKIGDIGGSIIDGAKSIFGVFSPSRRFAEIGLYLMQGLGVGIQRGQYFAQKTIESSANDIINTFNDTFKKIPDFTLEMNSLNPIITPVLDLSNIHKGAKDINRMLENTSFNPGTSVVKAQVLSDDFRRSREAEQNTEDIQTGPTEVTFIQNINSPKELSTADIYRNTKSQIALAKEELKIA